MARTFKVQAAHVKHTGRGEAKESRVKRLVHLIDIKWVASRFGNNRKMHAKAKATQRRIDRRRDAAADDFGN